jgi:hypothetical protein
MALDIRIGDDMKKYTKPEAKKVNFGTVLVITH